MIKCIYTHIHKSHFIHFISVYETPQRERTNVTSTFLNVKTKALKDKIEADGYTLAYAYLNPFRCKASCYSFTKRVVHINFSFF